MGGGHVASHHPNTCSPTHAQAAFQATIPPEDPQEVRHGEREFFPLLSATGMTCSTERDSLESALQKMQFIASLTCLKHRYLAAIRKPDGYETASTPGCLLPTS